MDTFGARLFYGSGAVFAEYRSAWKQGQPDIHIYVKEGFNSTRDFRMSKCG